MRLDFILPPSVCSVLVSTCLLAACGADSGGTEPDASATADTGASSDAEADGRDDVDPDALGDDPTDPDDALAALRRVFDELGLDPEDPTDLRLVWTDEERYQSYLAAWAVDQGVVFEPGPVNKAECLALDAFNPAVPYCGPGCGNDTTLAPPCLNIGCYEHDACYAAIECRSGEAIDVGLSFGPVTECCDAPLAPARAACRPVVAADFLAGRLTFAEVALFNAVSAIMIAVETSPVLDAPTDRAPGTCDETFAEACAAGELSANATPAAVGAGGEVDVCATLTRSDRPVGVWTLRADAPPVGSWSVATAEGRGELPACLRWAAPSDFDGVEGPLSLEVEGLVLGESVASDVVSVDIERPDVTLRAEGGTTRNVPPGETRSICFVAEQSGQPTADLAAAFVLAGTGSLLSDSGVTDGDGRVCASYTAPSAIPEAVEVLGASVGSAQASVAITVAEPVENIQVWAGTASVTRTTDEGSTLQEMDLRVTTREVDGVWSAEVEASRYVYHEVFGVAPAGCPSFDTESTLVSDGLTELIQPSPGTTAALGEEIAFRYSADRTTTLRFADNSVPDCPIRTSTQTNGYGGRGMLTLTADGQLNVRFDMSLGIEDAGELSPVP